MAGIGFELKKIFKNNSGILNSLKGYSVTAAVTEGPMLLTILMMFVMRYMLRGGGATYREQEIFLFTVTYVMIFSLIFSNTMLMFLDRYISDCVYKQKQKNIMASFYASTFFLLVIGGTIAFVYLLTIPMNWWYRVAALIQFSSMMIMWLQISYLSVLKQYTFVLIGFGAGTIVSIITAGILMYLGFDLLLSALWGVAIGFVVMLFLFMVQMLAHYPIGDFNLFVCFSALDEHKILAPTGFFMGLGLYGHNFVLWGSEFRNHVFPTGVYCMKYDIPVFFATLAITPLLVQFVVSLETNFSRRNRVYFDTILYGGRLDDIKAAKKEMEVTLYRELAHMLEVQLIFTIIAVTLFGNVLNRLGLDTEMIGIYRVLCFGYCFYGVFKSFTIILLYFDDKIGACIGSILFAVSSILFTVVTLYTGIDTWGMGFLVASVGASAYVLIRLYLYLKKLEYHVFCKQQLFQSDEKGIFALLEERIKRFEKDFKQRSKENAKSE